MMPVTDHLGKLFFCLVCLISATVGAYPLERVTDAGRYRFSLSPQNEPVPIGRIHNWILHAETLDGDEFQPTQFAVEGGMAGHGHGFPTQPQITRVLGQGDFLVSGVKFNMPGAWLLKIGLAGPAGWDTATFELSIDMPPNGQDSLNPERLRSLWIQSLGSPETDPSNRVSDDPRARKLGHQLFFEKGISANGNVACASCHQPERKFTDGLALSQGIGITQRHAPSLLGLAFSPWLYWDGRRDSLWAQALTPMEAQVEMGSTRTAVVRYVFEHDEYGPAYRTIFGDEKSLDFSALPEDAGPFGTEDAKTAWSSLSPARRQAINRAFANIGKAIAAYERVLMPGPARFDLYVEAKLSGAVDAAAGLLNEEELKGLELFLDDDKTQCLRCHSGPLFTNYGFHNLGTGGINSSNPDYGRLFGIRAAQIDEFNCLGDYSDANSEDCVEFHFMSRKPSPALEGAFKVPTFRNASVTSPYLHDGRFDTLLKVIEHYRHPTEEATQLSELQPIELTDVEINQLIAFIGTLEGQSTIDPRWLRAPSERRD
jgi:cytochrome c peroxidase